MTQQHPAIWSAQFWAEFRTQELPELTFGSRDGVLEKHLLERHLVSLFQESSLDHSDQELIRAATLLYHDHSDAAHDLVADRTDPTAALIHGILHRREPDFWNAKYWFRRCDMHPAYSWLAEQLHAWHPNQEKEAALTLMLPGTFDPFSFVDACERAVRRDNPTISVETLRKIQHAEFEAIIHHLSK